MPSCDTTGEFQVVFDTDLRREHCSNQHGPWPWDGRSHMENSTSSSAGLISQKLDGVAPGGKWQLLHLHGTELVGDGLTKPLCGQAFFRFLDDLGIQRQGPDEPSESDGSGAAIAALMTGGFLLSGMDSAEEEREADSDTLWVCGAILTTLGAIYLGRLTFKCLLCHLRRLRASSLSEAGSPWILCSGSGIEEESSGMPRQSGSKGRRSDSARALC